MHVEELPAALKVPEEHRVHVKGEETDAKLPAAQIEQEDKDVAPNNKEYFPVSHVVHDDAPEELLNLPGKHKLHDIEPGPDEYCPAGHRLQSDSES